MASKCKVFIRNPFITSPKLHTSQKLQLPKQSFHTLAMLITPSMCMICNSLNLDRNHFFRGRREDGGNIVLVTMAF
jgi:hypothetical protein